MYESLLVMMTKRPNLQLPWN